MMRLERRALIGVLAAVALAAWGAAVDPLPAGLHSPDHRVVCNRDRGICYDRYGPSVGLTEKFLGSRAAARFVSRS